MGFRYSMELTKISQHQLKTAVQRL